MARVTKINPITNISFIFSRNVCPSKSLSFFIGAPSAIHRFTKHSINPLMQCAISNIIPLPNRIIRAGNSWIALLELCFYKITWLTLLCQTQFFNYILRMSLAIKRIVLTKQLCFVCNALTLSRTMLANTFFYVRWLCVKIFKTYTADTFNFVNSASSRTVHPKPIFGFPISNKKFSGAFDTSMFNHEGII